MKLWKPEQYKQDMGRSLSEEERRQIEGGITPPHLIKSRCCYNEDTNDRWRLGRV